MKQIPQKGQTWNKNIHILSQTIETIQVKASIIRINTSMMISTMSKKHKISELKERKISSTTFNEAS
jgi:hypothetical protein